MSEDTQAVADIDIDEEFAQLLPPLAEHEREQLEQSLLDSVTPEPIEVWAEESVLLDGHNRLEIAQQNGIELAVREVSLPDRKAARKYILRKQFARRNLTPEGISYVRGLDYNAEKEGHGGDRKSSGKDFHLKSTRNRLADEYKVTGRTISNDARFAEALDDLETMLPGKFLAEVLSRQAGLTKKDVSQLYEIADEEGTARAQLFWKEYDENDDISDISAAKKAVRERDDAEKAAELKKQTDRYHVFCGDIAKLSEKQIEPGSMDAIITDPPYPKEHLPRYSELAEFAEWALTPGGIVAAMAGQSYLPDVLNRMAEHLDYVWTVCYYMPGPTVRQWQAQINTTWKPVVIYRQGEPEEDSTAKWARDYIETEEADKEHHEEWGQPEDAMAQLIQKFTAAGETVCDPFVGGGATAVAAVDSGRYFIGSDIEQAKVDRTVVRLNE